METVKTKNREKTVVRQSDGRFAVGTHPGPGRPKGQKNYSTIYREALEEVAKTQGLSSDEVESKIVSVAITEALNGDYRFYKDILDRAYGKAEQTHTVNTTTEQASPKHVENPLFDPEVAEIHDKWLSEIEEYRNDLILRKQS